MFFLYFCDSENSLIISTLGIVAVVGSLSILAMTDNNMNYV